MKIIQSAFAAFAAFVVFSSSAMAEIKTPAFFSDGMVLQQKTGAKIWGTAEAGQKVTVSFAGQTASSNAGQDGAWSIEFKDLKASKAGSPLTIEAGGDKKQINDVLVGEVRLASGQSKNYGERLECFIQDWRKRWDSGLSFYYVHLASFTKNGKDIPDWVMVQDEMRRLLDDSNSETGHIGMAVTNDIGHPTNIHPKNKKDVGQRLARWALHQDYGTEDIVLSGPLFKSYEVKGDAISVKFDHAESLKSRDGQPIGGFEIAGAENQWKPAEVSIAGNAVVSENKDLIEPTQARYAWKSNPTEANLVNGEGLPTSCFMTE